MPGTRSQPINSPRAELPGAAMARPGPGQDGARHIFTGRNLQGTNRDGWRHAVGFGNSGRMSEFFTLGYGLSGRMVGGLDPTD